MSATFTRIPSIAHAGSPASRNADGSSSPASGPAALQNSSSITDGGTFSRQVVITFDVGTCQSRAHGTPARCPASRRSPSVPDASGMMAIAMFIRIVSGSDMIRRRSGAGIRPSATAFADSASITPPPRWRSSSPSRAKSGSHPPARTAPPRTTAGTVTTG